MNPEAQILIGYFLLSVSMSGISAAVRILRNIFER